MTLIVLLCGCGDIAYDMPYDSGAGVSGFNIINNVDDGSQVSSFASSLCIANVDILDEEDMSKVEAAALFDLNANNVLYSKNAHERLYPASLTKIMTALVALKYGTLDQMLVATDAVNITESGAQLSGVKSGDKMTLDQALHALLMYSANDVAMLIAENIGGSVEEFVAMMNQEAVRLGATNTHFVNPHGLTDVDHYTTVYDLYLIFNEAIKYDVINEIIHMTSYQSTYFDKNGAEKELSFGTTNRYLKETVAVPANVTIIGGKTGTTSAAGHCLIILSKNASGAPFISVILRSESTDLLYEKMNHLLEKIQ